MLGTFVTERSIQDVLVLGHDKGIGVDGSGHGLKIPLVCALQVCARPGEFCCHVNMCQQCRVEQRCLGARPCSQHIALPDCLPQQASCLACWMQPPECVGVLPQCLPQRPPVAERGRRNSSAQPGAMRLSPRLPASSPATSSLAGILTPAATSAWPDGLAARAATSSGTEQLASEGEISGEAQSEEQVGGPGDANSQSTAAEAEEEVSDELQADIQVSNSTTTPQSPIKVSPSARRWLGLLC